MYYDTVMPTGPSGAVGDTDFLDDAVVITGPSGMTFR